MKENNMEYMNRANSKPADLILRMYESVIFPGKCIHLTGERRRSLRSVWAYDISYLYPRMEDGIDWMKFGLFESQKLDRKVPFYNRQQELFLKMAEKSSWIEQFVEYPEEIVYEEEFTLTFTPDYMMVLEDGSVVMVMLVPYRLFSTQTVQRKWYALMEYCKIHGYGCVLFDMVRGISLKWLLHLWEKKDMEKFEKEVLEAMDDRKSHWINSITLGKIMKKHGANLCDIQVLVFRNKLLYFPKGLKRKIYQQHFYSVNGVNLGSSKTVQGVLHFAKPNESIVIAKIKGNDLKMLSSDICVWKSQIATSKLLQGHNLRL